MQFYVGLILGVLIAEVANLLLLALCYASGRGDDRE